MPLLGARGNFLRFMLDASGYMTELARTYGDVVSLARGTTDYVFVFSPEYNEVVLSDTALFFNFDAESSPLRIPPGSALAHLFAGLTQMNGPRHLQQRRLLAAAFQREHLERYVGDVVAVVDERISRWQTRTELDLVREMKELALAIAVKTLLGLGPDDGADEMCEVLQGWIATVFSPASIALPVDVPVLPYGRLLARSRTFERKILDLIARRRKNGGNDALAMLLNAHDGHDGRLSDEELIGQTAFLLMAAHATTASALIWTLFLLDQHPNVLAGVAAESASVPLRAPVTLDQLDGLPLLDASIRESMRLLPPVLWWGRISTAPFRLGEYELPRGTRVIHSPYITHRMSRRFAEPRRFLPERWRGPKLGPYEYLPFSAGPRMCIGSNLAMAEMRLVLTMLLRRYQLRTLPQTRVDFGGFMLSAPKRSLRVSVLPARAAAPAHPVRGDIRRVVDLPR